MAIFHLNYRGCSPATGAGAVRKAAYQSGQALVEERSGQLCDYARKERVVEEGLSLPAWRRRDGALHRRLRYTG